MTPKQQAALRLGQAIRNVCCMDSLANRFFEPDLREKVRELCDEQMHRLGRESLTEHRERINKAFYDTANWDFPPNSFFRYKELPK